MANLKDTIVLGNLTVTGSVVASDILVSGTGNEFDTIKVNKISAKSQNNVYLEYGRDSGDSTEYYGWKTAGSNTYGFIFPSIDKTGGIGTDSNIYKYGYFQTVKTEAIYPTVAGATIEMCDILNERTWTIGTTGDLILNTATVLPRTSDVGYSGQLGGPNRCWDWMFSNYLTTNCVYATTILPRYSGTSVDSVATARDNTGSIGSSTNRWQSAYINDVRAYNGNYYVSFTASGLTVSTSSITPNIGSSSIPFNNIYGKSFYASSDIRLKENIVKSSFDYYNIINKIQLVNYTWKSDEQHILHHGLIAQQLKEILPEELHGHLISESTKDEKMMSVNDGKLVYFALGALQQQLQINNKLEQRIQKLEELLRGDK